MKNISKRSVVICGILLIIAFVNIVVVMTELNKSPVDMPISNERCVISVWTKDRHDQQFWMKKIEEYNKNNSDNITVRYQVFSDNYSQAVENAMNTKNAPDMLVYTQQIFNSNREMFADLSPFMDDDFNQQFQNVMVEELNVLNGKCYYIPTTATACRLFYNKDILKAVGVMEPPATMEELIEVAAKVNSQLSNQGIYGFAMNLKNAESALNRSIMKQGNMQLGLKGGYNFKTGLFEFTKYESLLTKWRMLLSVECSYPNCEDLDIDPLRKMFAEGKIAMYMSYSHAEFGAYNNQYQMSDEWGCTQVPVEAGMNIGAQNYSLNNGYLFNAQGDSLEEAWKVYCAIFADLQNLKEYHIQGYGISILPAVIDDTSNNEMMRLHPEVLIMEEERIWPLNPLERGNDVITLDKLNQYEVFKELILGDREIKSRLRQLEISYNTAYDEAIKNGLLERIVISEFEPMNPEIIP